MGYFQKHSKYQVVAQREEVSISSSPAGVAWVNFQGLTSVAYLMKTVKAPCFNEHDDTNELEEQ